MSKHCYILENRNRKVGAPPYLMYQQSHKQRNHGFDVTLDRTEKQALEKAGAEPGTI